MSLISRSEWLEKARSASVVPLALELTADTLTPFSLLQRLAARGRHPFLLESVEGGERVARYSFIGADPSAIITIRGQTTYVDGQPQDGDPLAALHAACDWGSVAEVEGLPPFAGGALGYFGYDGVRLVEDIPDANRDELGLPEAWFGLYDTVVAIDKARQRLVLIHAARIDGDDHEAIYERGVAKLKSLSSELSKQDSENRPRAIPDAPDDPFEGWSVTPSEEAYLESVAQAKEEILAGEIFQVVLSRRWRKPARCQALEIYRMLRLTNPSPYMFYLDTGHARILGASPEMLVRVEDGKAFTCPIAGTRPRGKNRAEDAALAEELLADPKERAEHVMLVDLGRNDLGRVASPGTVSIDRKMEIERYSHVMHIVSELSAELSPEVDAWEALAACFPAGTLSGAPKVRAMEIIDELEDVRRGVYGGAVGYRTFSGDLDACIAIRCLVESGGILSIQAGAGIVHDSVPSSELAECQNKAKAVAAAVAMAERDR